MSFAQIMQRNARVHVMPKVKLAVEVFERDQEMAYGSGGVGMSLRLKASC